MDNYIVSARKYRPSTFKNVVGQKSLSVTLKNAIQSNKLAHAYLFCGPRGVGKTSCARIFAKTINCMDLTAEGEACNTCESCLAFNESRSYNIHELDAASNNSVDDIRSLIEQVRIPPAIGKYKVFIIDEVHMLSSSAFNAFLKTLEEPPRHALFILATTEKHKVLPTILSRCQIYDFARISIADIVEHLQYVASCEGVTADPEALNVIAQKADGGMRDALSVFDQVASFTGGKITYQAVIDNLNVLDYEYYFRLTDAMLEGNIRASLLILNEILRKGFDGHNLVTGLASHFRDLLVSKDESTLVLLEVGASTKERYKQTALRCSDQLLFKAIELANTCDLNYKASRNKDLLLQLTLIQLSQLNGGTSSAGESKKKGLIEPIPQSSAPAASPKQASPPASSAGIVTSQFPQGTIVIPKNQSKTPPASSGFSHIAPSLADMANKKDTAQAADTEKIENMSCGFTQEQLLAAWDAYSQTIDKEVYLKNTMINCKPVLQEDFTFEVSIHNPGQQELLQNGCVNILSFLRSKLQNSRIQMRTRIDETNVKHLAYTSTEKYEHLLEINKALATLKEAFNLRLD